MFEFFKSLLGGLFFNKELAELDRRKTLYLEYRRWLAEFHDVSTVLDNMEAEARGEGLCMSHPCTCAGPWDIHILRDNLRFKQAEQKKAKDAKK